MLAAEQHDAVVPVVDVVDSYRRVESEESYIVPRSSLRIVQTPQTFKAEVLRKAYSLPFDTSFTDDASVVEAAGYRVSLVDGERQNIKLTTPEDVEYAEWILSRE
jgi:2-C-methyl-D-erythritol 4-phosphate cytidylyltransferase